MGFYEYAFGIFFVLSFALLIGIYVQENGFPDGSLTITCEESQGCINPFMTCDSITPHAVCAYRDEYCTGENTRVCNQRFLTGGETIAPNHGFLYRYHLFIFGIFAALLLLVLFVYDNAEELYRRLREYHQKRR